MPNVWTDREDERANPICDRGPVQNTELVARLLNKTMRNSETGIQANAFQREFLCPPAKRSPQNMCGKRDGESLVRAGGLSNEDAVEMSRRQFAENSAGVALAKTADIRAISDLEDNNSQMFFIYEDPTNDLPQHCVIRFNGELHRAKYTVARKRLLEVFSEIID